MCSIAGSFCNPKALKIVKDALKITVQRGRDAYGLFDGREIKIDGSLETESKNVIGHNLHAIVENIPQPLKYKDAYLVSNCEIYNWKELSKKYGIGARNDSELLLKLIYRIGIRKALNALRGVYAFCYWKGNDVYLGRDIIGIKPLWYSLEHGLAFCSEKKGIKNYFNKIDELNPREILHYNLKSRKAFFLKRKFFSLEPISDDIGRLKRMLVEAVRIRQTDKKFGVLFSGGLDSVLIAKILKDAGKDFTCYTAAISEDSPDLVQAKSAAKKLGLELKYKIIGIDDAESYIKKILPLIEDNNVIKAGVALPLFIASVIAKEDGCRVIYSGSGADEVFAGYDRYKKASSDTLNKDLYSDILKIYEKNTYRDDVITMNNNLELRVPFLDKKLVAYAIRFDAEMKIKEGIEKKILREIAVDLGVPRDIAARKKKAAQYGSGFDKAIAKLARKNGFESKSSYLENFYKEKNLKLAALVSGGKDSLFAAYTMQQQNYDVSCFVTIKSENENSYMFHTPNIDLVEMQAEASGIPLIYARTKGKKEDELIDLKKALEKAKDIYGVEGVITGALYSNYQRERIEKICDKIGLKIFSPLWHIDQEFEMRELLRKGFRIVFSSIAAYGLDSSWLGREITEKDVDKLVLLNKKIRLNIAGEGGEFESLVLDCPMFNKMIEILDSEIIVEDENTARLAVKKARLV